VRILTLTALAILCSHTPATDPPHFFEAKVVKIADGDTITVCSTGGSTRSGSQASTPQRSDRFTARETGERWLAHAPSPGTNPAFANDRTENTNLVEIDQHDSSLTES
jgi:hypothetical protein